MTKNSLFILVLFLGLAACQGTKTNSDKEKEATPLLVEITYKVEGMTCDHCEISIQKGVKELEGIEMVLANHEDSTTIVKFDRSKLSEDQIKEAIKKRGYEVKSKIN